MTNQELFKLTSFHFPHDRSIWESERDTEKKKEIALGMVQKLLDRWPSYEFEVNADLLTKLQVVKYPSLANDSKINLLLYGLKRVDNSLEIM